MNLKLENTDGTTKHRTTTVSASPTSLTIEEDDQFTNQSALFIKLIQQSDSK